MKPKITKELLKTIAATVVMKAKRQLLKTVAAAVGKGLAKIATRGLTQHGGSLSVNLPRVWCQDNRLKSRDKVDIFRSPNGSLIIRVHKRVQKVKRKVDT